MWHQRVKVIILFARREISAASVAATGCNASCHVSLLVGILELRHCKEDGQQCLTFWATK